MTNLFTIGSIFYVQNRGPHCTQLLLVDAVRIEPPDAREDLLVEDGAVWAEKGPHVAGVALVPGLAAGLGVDVDAIAVVGAAEGSLGDGGENRVVDVGFAGDILTQPVQALGEVDSDCD